VVAGEAWTQPEAGTVGFTRFGNTTTFVRQGIGEVVAHAVKLAIALQSGAAVGRLRHAARNGAGLKRRPVRKTAAARPTREAK
jgi:hypothetical protein